MAIDQNLTPSETAAVPAVENELPAYRAISAAAVISLILGVVSILSFADWSFLAFAVLAIAAGLYADRKIQRFSDTLTGRRLAQAGTALGLIFGLSAVTYGFVQEYVQKREAARYAQRLADTLKNGSYEEIQMERWTPLRRAGKSKEEILAAIRKEEEPAKSAREEMGDEMRNAGVKQLKARLALPSATIHFDQIERTAVDGSTAVATARFKVEGPGNAEFPDKEQFALLVFKSDMKGPRYDWWVDQIVFPYKPLTYAPAPKPVDDGHGHGDGHAH